MEKRLNKIMKSYLLYSLIRIILLCSIFSLSSCEDKVETRRREQNVENKIATNRLIQKWGALLLNDSVNKYAYWFQEKLIEHSIPLAIRGGITDVYKINNNFVLQIAISTHNEQNFVAEVVVDSVKMDIVKKQLRFDGIHYQKGSFIIRVSNVISRSPSLEYHDVDKDNDDPYVSLGDADNRLIIFKGSLIDYYLNEVE